VSPREVARLALGCAQLLAPRRLASATLDERLSPTDQWVARVLGLRNVAQAILTATATSRANVSPVSRTLPVRRALAIGAAVDLLHASSMVALAATSRRHRWLASAEALEATWFGVDQLLARRDVAERRAADSRRLGASVARRRDVEARMAALDDTSVVLDPEEPAFERRRANAAALQRAIDSVEGRGGQPHEVAAVLADAVAAQGLPPQPRVWLQAVADELAAGRHYVVSTDSSQHGS
jgi:hypothetical protein